MIVLDTSFLVAWANEQDAHHAAATQARSRLTEGAFGPAPLPEYVLLETATVLAARKDLASSVRFCEALLDSREIELVACAPFLLDAMRVFRAQKRFQLSFTDAAIVAIGRTRGASHLATFDDALARASGLEQACER